MYHRSFWAAALVLMSLSACAETPPVSSGEAPRAYPLPTATPTLVPTAAPTSAPTVVPPAQPSPSNAAAGEVCGPPPAKSIEQRVGPNGEFCVLWKDTLADETGFRITLDYTGKERFIYELPANSTALVVPATDTPQRGNCARSSFSLTIEALQPSGPTLVDGMAMDGECY